MKQWSIAHLDKLKADGKIRGYSVQAIKKEVQTENGKMITKAFSKRSKEKEWIEFNLVYWCNARGHKLIQEFRFHPVRKWKSDWAIPSQKILIEYEGMNSEKSGHLTFGGYTKDTEKYREAAKLGFIVLRYTMKNYKALLGDLNELITTSKEGNV